MIKRFLIPAVVALVVIVIVAAIYMYVRTRNSPIGQTGQVGQTVQTVQVATAANCPATAQNYFKQYQAQQKASGKTITSFLMPQTHFNAVLKACLVVVGVAYADHSGSSEDVWIVDASTGHSILRWSNAVRYFDDAGPAEYTDPSKEGIITYTPAFQARAQVLLGQ